MNRLTYLVLVHLFVSLGFSAILFERDFSEPLTGPASNVRVLAESLDFKFHRETGGRLWMKDYNDGVCFSLDPGIMVPGAHPTVYVSFSLRSLNATTRDKFAGIFFYANDREVFGMGNDYASENFSFWTADGQGVPIGDVPVRVDSDVHKIVMRIDFHADGPETLTVGLDPFCRRSEARQPDHIWTVRQQELAFDEIRFRCGNDDCAWAFDDLRIGTDWASVTPSDNRPGAYVESVTAASQASAKTEMIHKGITRCWPSETTMSGGLPSFVLDAPHPPVRAVSTSLSLKPRFGRFDGKKYAYLSIPAQTDLYGTGEVTGSLLRNGYKIVLFNKDNYGYGKPDQLYQSHPWVLGLREDGTAFGVIFDTPWKAELDLRAGILFTVSEQAPDFSVIVIDGENPQDVLVKLAALTGTMPMPPRWALGYHQCRYSYHPDARVREVVDTFRAKRIPCDVIWFDIDYMDGFRIFTFDPNEYPAPADTNGYLHAMGFKSVWMIDPGVKKDPGYFVYDRGTAGDAWVRNASGSPYVGPVWPGDCVFPDFTMPTVRTWWTGLYQNFMAKGIDGVWNDMNEPAVFNADTNGTMPLDNWHRGGGGVPAGPHEQYHNVYGMLMVKASRAGIQAANPDKRPFVLSRANFLGGHRYAATWTGDNKATWEHLKWSIPMSLNLSLSGQPFNGPDIGGFIGDAEPDLWAHWIAVGAFYPFSRAHTSNDTANQEPWAFGQSTEDAARIALQRRYRLMPYLYTLFYHSHVTGLPVMRPVLFADTTDVSLRMEDQAFLLGADVMVIPRWATDVRLPQGIWRSVSILDAAAEKDDYQCALKIRGGAIVPLGPVVQTTEQILRQQHLTLLVVLDENGQAEGTLYEDAGDGYGFRDGEFCLSGFKAQRQGTKVRITCSQQDGQWTSEKRLVSVTVIDDKGMHYGFGDICTGIHVNMGDE